MASKRRQMINQIMGYEPGKKKAPKRSKRSDFVSGALQNAKPTNGNRKYFNG